MSAQGRPVGAEVLYFAVDPGFHPGLTSGHPVGVENGRADRRGQGGKFIEMVAGGNRWRNPAGLVTMLYELVPLDELPAR